MSGAAAGVTAGVAELGAGITAIGVGVAIGVVVVDSAGMVTGAGIGVGGLTGSATIGVFVGRLLTWLASGRAFLTTASPAGLADGAGLAAAMPWDLIAALAGAVATVGVSGMVSLDAVVCALLDVLVVALSGVAAGAIAGDPGKGVDVGAVACGPDGWVLRCWVR